MRRSLIFVLAALCAGHAGCQFLPQTQGPRNEPDARAQALTPLPVESVLYARDGSIVTPTEGSAASNLPRREVQNGEGSRAKILELYERVVEERDQLRLTLSAREVELAQARQQLEQESTRAAELDSRARSTEVARLELVDQNLDLAGRLTMAQIRRLEAEKKWLELSISLPSKTVATSSSLPVSSPPVANPAIKADQKASEQYR